MIYENIYALCKEKGICIAKLERECGLGNATIRRWKASSPTADNLKIVAEYFGTTVDSLLSESSLEAAPKRAGTSDCCTP